MTRYLALFAVTVAAWGLSACAARTGAWPAQRLADAREVERATDGYRIPVWFGRSHVTIAEPDWLYYTTIFPATRNVIDPETGASFRFDYVRIGRDWREFWLWGWTVRTHE